VPRADPVRGGTRVGEALYGHAYAIPDTHPGAPGYVTAWGGAALDRDPFDDALGEVDDGNATPDIRIMSATSEGRASRTSTTIGVLGGQDSPRAAAPPNLDPLYMTFPEQSPRPGEESSTSIGAPGGQDMARAVATHTLDPDALHMRSATTSPAPSTSPTHTCRQGEEPIYLEPFSPTTAGSGDEEGGGPAYLEPGTPAFEWEGTLSPARTGSRSLSVQSLDLPVGSDAWLDVMRRESKDSYGGGSNCSSSGGEAEEEDDAPFPPAHRPHARRASPLAGHSAAESTYSTATCIYDEPQPFGDQRPAGPGDAGAQAMQVAVEENLASALSAAAAGWGTGEQNPGSRPHSAVAVANGAHGPAGPGEAPEGACLVPRTLGDLGGRQQSTGAVPELETRACDTRTTDDERRHVMMLVKAGKMSPDDVPREMARLEARHRSAFDETVETARTKILRAHKDHNKAVHDFNNAQREAEVLAARDSARA